MVSPAAVTKYSGTFIGRQNQSVSGEALIVLENGKYALKLMNFRSDNGPDLKVYLSKESTPSSPISLGDLKSTNGNQVYEIPGMPDFEQYRYALIHCERFNHLFGSAELKNQGEI
ncbi:MAG: DM13 domain-containing protein [Chitinophagaceae bacterium]